MRLLPAHVHDAKEMARALCNCLAELGLTTDRRDPGAIPPSLQQTQELMAKAFGYGSWHELTALLKQAHKPVYLDGLDEKNYSRLSEELVSRLAVGLGFDYAHGYIWNAVGNSGIGRSPKTRRAMQDNSSPWGPIDEESEIAPGIRSVSTAGHGGLILSDERQLRMPAHLRLEGAAYEEDGEFNLVALGFPDEAREIGINLRNALAYLGIVDRSNARVAHDELVMKMLNSGQSLLELKLPEFIEPALTDLDAKVILYLVQCVRENRLPIRFPKRDDPPYLDKDDAAKLDRHTLAEWVSLLSRIPMVDGHWATRNGPWFEHWAWQLRDAEVQAAYERQWQRAIAQEPGR